MSGRLRRLRRLAEKVRLQKVQLNPEAQKHGCPACRDQLNRQDLAKQLVESGELGGVKAKCPKCGADWDVRFMEAPDGSACIMFSPVPAGVPN